MSDERKIELEIVVPGTPEQVWEAIATGPGISSWFVPAEVDPHQGGKVTMQFGDAGEDISVIDAWDPPRRFAAIAEEERRGQRVAVEYLVEARDGGSCVVRFVQSGFGSGAEWDDEYDETTRGWLTFFHNLRLYLTFFPGQQAAQISVVTGTASTQEEVWAGLATDLGLAAITPQRRFATTPDAAAAGAPQLAGIVDRLVDAHANLVLDEPAPGFVVLGAGSYEGTTYVNLTGYMFGADAAATAAREQPRWQAWVTGRFPPPAS